MRGIINSKDVEKAEVQEQRRGIVSLMLDSLRERGKKNENMEKVYSHTYNHSKNLYLLSRFMTSRRVPLKLSQQQITVT